MQQDSAAISSHTLNGLDLPARLNKRASDLLEVLKRFLVISRTTHFNPMPPGSGEGFHERRSLLIRQRPPRGYPFELDHSRSGFIQSPLCLFGSNIAAMSCYLRRQQPAHCSEGCEHYSRNAETHVQRRQALGRGWQKNSTFMPVIVAGFVSRRPPLKARATPLCPHRHVLLEHDLRRRRRTDGPSQPAEMGRAPVRAPFVANVLAQQERLQPGRILAIPGSRS